MRTDRMSPIQADDRVEGLGQQGQGLPIAADLKGDMNRSPLSARCSRARGRDLLSSSINSLEIAKPEKKPSPAPVMGAGLG